MTARGADGDTERATSRFTAEDLALDHRTYASIVRPASEPVGEGTPVLVRFHVAATTGHRRAGSAGRHHAGPDLLLALGERQRCAAAPGGARKGRHRGDRRLRRRLRLRRRRISGLERRSIVVTAGTSVLGRGDVATRTTTSPVDGDLIRLMPVSAGEAGFEIRSATTVIMGRRRASGMDAAMTGIAPATPSATTSATSKARGAGHRLR